MSKNSCAQGKYSANELNHYAQLELMNWIDVKANTILDLGCGDGKTAREIQKLVPHAKIYGLTANQQEAIENTTAEIEIKYGDVHDLVWENNSFEFVYARHILEHCITPFIALKEINRVLKKGGLVAICVPDASIEWILKWKDHYSVLPELMWEKLFEETEFKIVRKEYGTWLASYSVKDEKEIRYLLRKEENISFDKIELKNDKKIEVYKPQDTEVFVEPSKSISKDIGFIVHNYVVYETLKPTLKYLDEKKISYEFLVPNIDEDIQAEKMFKDTYNKIKEEENPVREIDGNFNEKYRIIFYPFLPFYFDVEADYKVRYQYGMGKAAYNFDIWSMNFDYIFCNSTYDEKFLSPYAVTKIIGLMKFINFKKSEKRLSRKKILYMPTYGELSSLSSFLEQIPMLKETYDISIKLHHMTTYYEEDLVEKLKEIVNEDNIYNHLDPINNILKDVDLIITDGSGAIFDSIATEIPCIVINNKISRFLDNKSYEEILFEKGIVVLVEEISNLINSIKTIFKDYDFMVNKIKEEKNKLFPIQGNEVGISFIKAIVDILNNNLETEKVNVKRNILKNFHTNQKEIIKQQKMIELFTNTHKEQRKALVDLIEKRDKRVKELSIELNQYVLFDQEKQEKIKELNQNLDELLRENKNYQLKLLQFEKNNKTLENELEELKAEHNNLTEKLICADNTIEMQIDALKVISEKYENEINKKLKNRIINTFNRKG